MRTARIRPIAAMAATIALALATAARAEGTATPTAPDGAASAASTGAGGDLEAQMIESAQRGLRSSTLWLARGVDSWFGDIPFERNGGVSDGILWLDVLYRQDQKTDFNVRLNARFRLPNVQRNAYFLLGRDDRREIVTDQPGAVTRQQRLLPASSTQTSFFAGLGLTLRDNFDFRVGLRGGLKPYVQARYRRSWSFGEQDHLDARQTFFWSQSDRLGSTSALSYEHEWSPMFVTRLLGTATITQDSPHFEWASVGGGYFQLPNQRVLSVEALLLGRQGSGVDLTDYGARVRWEQPLRGPLLGEVTVGHFWPRPDAASPRGRAWALGAGLALKF